MKPFVISWTKQSTYNQCPHKFFLLYGSKVILGKEIIPFQTNAHMEKGNVYHALMESAGSAIKHSGRAPKSDNPYWQEWWGKWIQGVANKYKEILIEEKMGVDNDLRGWSLGEYWQPDRGVFGNRSMRYQGKLDLMAFNKNTFSHPTIALNIDWKSGKERLPERLGQLGFYAFMMMSFWPSLEVVTSMNIFLDLPFDEVLTRCKHWKIRYTRKDDYEDLKHYYHHESEKIYRSLELNQWDCTQNMCNWCPATKEHCKYGSA